MKQRIQLSKLLIMLSISLLLMLSISIISVATPSVAIAGIEDEISYKKTTPESPSGYYNYAEGVDYHVSFPAETLSFSFVFDMDDSEYKGEFEFDKDWEQDEYAPITFAKSLIPTENGRKVVSTLFRKNGRLEIEAKIDKGLGDTITSDTIIDVKLIDVKHPTLDRREEYFVKTSPTRYTYYFYAVDPQYTQELTATSGLDTVAVFFDATKSDIADWDLPEKTITLEDIATLEHIEIIEEWQDLSKIRKRYSLEESFEMSKNGDYYIYLSDWVGNSTIAKLFTVRDIAEYVLILGHQEIDCVKVIDSANQQINSGEGKYSPLLINELKTAVDNFEFAVITEQDYDSQREAYNRLHNAQQRYAEAKSTYNVTTHNKELFPGKIEVSGLNEKNFNTLIGDKIIVDIVAVEFRENFNQELTCLVRFNPNRILKLDYKVTKNGNLTIPQSALKLYMSIPASYQQLQVVSKSNNSYSLIDIEKGAEWLEFFASKNQEEFYLIIFDTALGKTKNLLWLYITLPIFVAILAGIGFLIYTINTKKRKHLVKEHGIIDTDNKKEDGEIIVNTAKTNAVNTVKTNAVKTKTSPNNKSKKNKKKK